MVIYFILVFIIVVLAYMYCTERKISVRYKAIASDLAKNLRNCKTNAS